MRRWLSFWLPVLVLSGQGLVARCTECCDPGAYMQFFGGYNRQIDERVTVLNQAGARSYLEADFDWGYFGGAALGYEWGSAAAFELEVSYRHSEVDSLEVGGTNYTSSDGHDILAFMGNGYFRYLCSDWSVVPYVGAGLGYAHVHAEINRAATINMDDEDHLLAYQGIVGLSYMFCKNWEVFGEYRYFRTSPPDFWGSSAELVNMDLHHHSIGIGVRMWLYTKDCEGHYPN